MELIDKKRCYLFSVLYKSYKKDTTQKEIADYIGVTPRAIQNWNASKNKIAKTHFESILNLFSLPKNLFDSMVLDDLVTYVEELDTFTIDFNLLMLLEKKDEQFVKNVDTKKQKENIDNLIEKCFIEFGKMNDYELPIGSIDNETVESISKYMKLILSNDYRNYYLNSKQKEIDKEEYMHNIQETIKELRLDVAHTKMKNFYMYEIKELFNTLEMGTYDLNELFELIEKKEQFNILFDNLYNALLYIAPIEEEKEVLRITNKSIEDIKQSVKEFLQEKR